MKRPPRFLRAAVRAAGSLAACIPLFARLIPGRRPHLAILKNDGLGDIILFLPFASVLYREFKARGYRVSMIVREPWAELVRRAGIADRVVVQPPYRNALQWLLFRFSFWISNCFDVVIEGVCRAHDLTDCCRPRERIDIYLDPAWRSSAPRTRSFDVSGLTIRERYALLLRACGISAAAPEPDCGALADPVPAEWVAEPFIALCADASDPRRCWPEENFADVAGWLWERYRKRIVFVGSDRGRAEAVAAAMPKAAATANLCGKTTLFQLFALLEAAEFVVSGETGTVHAAAACGARAFAVCGRGDLGTFIPYPEGVEGKTFFSIYAAGECRACNWRGEKCSRLPVYECVAAVSPAAVKRAIEAHVPAGEAARP